ncbi:MAG: DUF6171 family protein [Lachnospiraceae bacterium]|nr:DUF6171 family protein [Lachnospiraceae bacterium]
MAKTGCVRCLLRDLSIEDRKKIEKYISVIKKEERADDALYNKRLDICLKCDRLSEGTCLSCGCYVEFRAATAVSSCPKKKW